MQTVKTMHVVAKAFITSAQDRDQLDEAVVLFFVSAMRDDGFVIQNKRDVQERGGTSWIGASLF